MSRNIIASGHLKNTNESYTRFQGLLQSRLAIITKDGVQSVFSSVVVFLEMLCLGNGDKLHG